MRLVKKSFPEIISFCIFIFIVLSIVTCCFNDKTKITELDAYISLITQVLSVLVGFAYVGTTFHLSGYSVSEPMSDLLKSIEKVARKIKKIHLQGPPKKAKIRKDTFLSRVMLNVGIEVLQLRDDSDQYYVFRPYWDGVWYQVFWSPYKEKTSSKEQLFSIECLHEVTICAAKIVGIIHELRHNNINLLTHNQGSQGSRNFIKKFEELIEKYSSLKNGDLPNHINIDDSILITYIAIYSEHYMLEELNNYSEEVNWEPYELAYFEVVINEYMLWICYLIHHIQRLRFSLVERRTPGLTEKFSDTTIKKLGFEDLSKQKKKILELRKSAINIYGVNKRYKEIKQASIPGIG